MTDAPYRDTDELARRELAAEIDVRRRQIPVAATLAATYAARVARAIGGAAMTATLLVGETTAGLIFAGVVMKSVFRDVRPPLLAAVLVASWAVGLGAWQLARPLARRRFARRLAAASDLLAACAADPDPHRALAELEATPSPIADARHRIDRWQSLGLAMPMVACSLAMPLTLHFVCFAAWSGFTSLASVGPVYRSNVPGWYRFLGNIAEFDTWIALSAIVVGHAHLVLATHAALFVRGLRRLLPEAPPPSHPGRRGLIAAIVASAIPGGIILLIPPALTFITGVVFVPLMYRAAADTFVRERFQLAWLPVPPRQPP